MSVLFMVARLFSKKPRSRVVAPSLQKYSAEVVQAADYHASGVLSLSGFPSTPSWEETQSKLATLCRENRYCLGWEHRRVPGKRDIWDIALSLAPS